MASFNNVTLLGNLTRDVAIRTLPSNTSVADFGMAMSKKFKTKSGEEKESVCFIDCKVWGKGADIIAKYAQKGSQLLVSGELELETWEDKNGGGKRSKHVVNVSEFKFVGGFKDGQRTDRSSSQERPSRGPSQRPAQPEDSFSQDDVPF